jgi:hypothetical protein
MQALQCLRKARFLARLVLVWFAFSLGVAVASPLVKPNELDVICTGTGTGAGAGAMKLVIKGEAGGKVAGHSLDCPLCAGTAAPPPVIANHLSFVSPLGHAVRPIPAAHIAASLFAPLPARGPPATLAV